MHSDPRWDELVYIPFYSPDTVTVKVWTKLIEVRLPFDVIPIGWYCHSGNIDPGEQMDCKCSAEIAELGPDQDIFRDITLVSTGNLNFEARDDGLLSETIVRSCTPINVSVKVSDGPEFAGPSGDIAGYLIFEPCEGSTNTGLFYGPEVTPIPEF